MAKIVLAVIAAVASFMLVDSLSCNKCSFGLVGLCLSSSTETCSTNTSTCYTGTVAFPSLTSFSGFTSRGCRSDTAACNITSNSTLLGVSYNLAITCCSTDNCNPTSGAPSAKITLSAAIAAAVLASAWGSML
ncbi:lymphocyte antigen-6, epidermis [Haplochromis burtoni]|uniref:lymphocyte antigen-6, epidermis n=1 Tax=Haplochromis burtoni TaxID=8153 RepID=UPI001C2D6894|nr:lymphocyte antigen-6, epidermis [Haplochromis burtoni]